MKKSYFKRGFTLIELLVVVGILAVLAIAALIAINPVEAQRRSRDSARLQDMARLSAALEASINDVGQPWVANTIVRSSTGAGNNAGVRSQPCGVSWVGVDFCDYLKQVPLDPQNGRPVSALTGAGTAANPTRASIPFAHYTISYAGASGHYRICTSLESDKNFEVLATDGGVSLNFFETGSNVSLPVAQLPACT